MTHTWPYGHSQPAPLSEAEIKSHIDEKRAEHLWVASSDPMPAIWGPYRRPSWLRQFFDNLRAG